MIKSKENKDIYFTLNELSEILGIQPNSVRIMFKNKNQIPTKIKVGPTKKVNAYSKSQVLIVFKIPILFAIVKKPKKQYFEFSETVISKKSSLWN